MNKKFLSLAVAATLVVSAVGVGSAFANENENENGEAQYKWKASKMNQEKLITSWDQLSDEEIEAKLFEKAQSVGIETDGKTFEEVQEELRAYASENGAKGKRGYGPKEKGLNPEKLAEKWDGLTEEQQNQFFERAAKLGIETDGKSFEEVMAAIQELHEVKVIEKAEELGIDTNGKSIEEIQEELRAYASVHGKEKLAENWDELTEEQQNRFIESVAKLGIETEGKSIEEIQEELKTLAPERGKRGQGSNGLKFDQEKFVESWNQLSDEEKEVKLFEHAKKLGIETEGKTFEEIQVELQEQREARLFEKAQKLGIDTEGKTVDQIKDEMKELAPKKGQSHEVTL
ncbi:hypothetical protein [Chengkuizengella sediminis]|uniref:hypothetical protein n=1 Tax=Chengkuizengella sediminis TaxID=1885917 RepID=UPI001389E01A|nr:hypothetical protein [Chengkuizengella sediminis]NDI34487.1 hypothetical protein [Chengkuizengella sediminis]